jgi:cation-transporting P-type ATPase E
MSRAPSGLTAAEVQDRCRRGEVNAAVSGTTRSYAQILRRNVFSFFNTVLFVIGIALLVLGRGGHLTAHNQRSGGTSW